MAAQFNVEGSLRTIFSEARSETQRIVLAQIVFAFYEWDPVALMMPPLNFEERFAEALAVERLIGELHEATGRPFPEILKTLPEPMSRLVVCYGLLHRMRRPLALLAGHLALPESSHAPSHLEAALLERKVTADPADLQRESPYRRILVVQCHDRAAPTVDQGAVTLLRVGRQEALDLVVGEQVLDFVLESWDWKLLAVSAGQRWH